jgi:hypothetical protein
MSRAENEAAREQAVIVELRKLREDVVAEGEWLAGAEFADERGHLDEQGQARLRRVLEERPWKLGAWLAHEQRVRLDHPELFSRWISGEIGRARRAKLGYGEWQQMRDRRSRWRIDSIESPPRGDLFELEERSTWRVSEVETGRVVVERCFERSASYVDGKWVADEDAWFEPAMRVESDVVFVRHPDGRVEELELI